MHSTHTNAHRDNLVFMHTFTRASGETSHEREKKVCSTQTKEMF